MRVSRVMFAAASSGSGKTTAVCAVLSLLKRRGAGVKACKCGPDYIDPMFHKTVTGVQCTNLDPFFCDEDLLKYLLCKNAGEDITVIEGVMGYYDGTVGNAAVNSGERAGGKSGECDGGGRATARFFYNSTYTVADRTGTPVILVVDAKGASLSVLAVIEGFLRFVSDSHIKGVLLNRISAKNYRNLAGLIRERFKDSVIPVGYIPELPGELRIPSRHLGLVTASEIDDIGRRLERAADICEETIDIDAIMSIADGASEIRYKEFISENQISENQISENQISENQISENQISENQISENQISGNQISENIISGNFISGYFDRINIAIACDQAFCFYYDDTLRMFEEMGAKLLFFSPLANEPVPAESDGLLLGGGYPEIYSDILEANTRSKESIKEAVISGMPVIAECGGFQYLGKELDGRKMCAVLEHSSANAGRLVRFGYLTIKSRKAGLLGEAGTELLAHEFHYWDSTDNGKDFTARKPDGREWECAVMTDTIYAGYPHLYLPANPEAAACFYKKCLEFRERKK